MRYHDFTAFDHNFPQSIGEENALEEYRPIDTCPHGWCVKTTCPKCGELTAASFCEECHEWNGHAEDCPNAPTDDETDPKPSNED